MLMDEHKLNELAANAHANAVRHGFWQAKNSKEHALMLVLTEISEAVEADRCENKGIAPTDFRGRHEDLVTQGYTEEEAFAMVVKGCKYDELADVCIRLLDLAGSLEMDFGKLNPSRYYRAYAKFTFTENAFGLAKGLTKEHFPIERRIQYGLHYVEEWCYAMGESIEWYINAKMAYNEGREYLHGKKY